MSDGAGNSSPKTLADVSHLFFSANEETSETAPGGSVVSPPEATESNGPTDNGGFGEDPGRWHRTNLICVTGSDDRPGKSTVAINLSHSLLTRGYAGFVDAYPSLPNGRFYPGLPSWQSLSPVTSEGHPAPITVLDSGLVVLDWAAGAQGAHELLGSGAVVYVDIEDAGRVPLHHLVIDLPLSRARRARSIVDRVALFVVVSAGGRASFEEAYGVLAALNREVGVREVGLVVNRAGNLDEAADFHEKLELAANRLLSMKLSFLGGVSFRPNLGSEQRERGAIVEARPNAVIALELMEVAARAREIAAER